MFESQTPIAKCKRQELLRSIDEAHQLARCQRGGVGGEHGVRGGVPGRLPPERFLDGHGLGHGLADQIGIADGLGQVGGVAEPSKGVIDLRAGGAALRHEELRVFVVEGLALLEAGGDRVVHGDVLAVKGHLPGDL